MRFEKWELVFTIGGSRRLYDWIKENLAATDCRIHVFLVPRSVGLSEGRNIGAQHSRGKLIAFLDDDVVVDEEWATALTHVLSEPGVVAVTGPSDILSEAGELSWFPTQFLWLIGCTRWAPYSASQEVRNVWGTNMAFRRIAFANGKGFSTSMGLQPGARGTWAEVGAEEVEFSLRLRRDLGLSIMYCEEMRVYHRVTKARLTPSALARRAFWVGRSRRLINSSQNNAKFGLNLELKLLQGAVRNFVQTVLPAKLIGRKGSSEALRVVVIASTFLILGYFYESAAQIQHLLAIRIQTILLRSSLTFLGS